MLTNEQILANKERYLELITSIEREGVNIDKLVQKLENSDFFYAPSSTKYHCNYEGGLCEHSLNVYDNLLLLIDGREGLDECCYDSNTLKIVSLLHDISKMNIYEKTAKNEKIYCDDGDKYDALGKFKWVTTMGWKLREDKFTYGSHEMTSEFIARQFVPLTLDESVAILHHMGGMHYDCAQDNIGEIFSQYQIAMLLHMADMMSVYVSEKG
jgi:hypothetical protein